MMTGGVLVSVGLPTYNRLNTLKRAIESVLTQDYHHLELVISDDESTDGTRAYCEDLARRDSRVRYIRQSKRLGLVRNYSEVMNQSRGEWYMVLGDDDWIDPGYISRCLRTALSQSELIMVCGLPRLYRGTQLVGHGAKTNLLQASGSARVASYYRHVSDNAVFHGMVRRSTLALVPPMQNHKSSDLPYVASIAFMGKIKTVEDVCFNKSAGVSSGGWHSIRKAMNLSTFDARFPGVRLFVSAFSDIAWASPVYSSLGWFGRLFLAFRVAFIMVMRYPTHMLLKLVRLAPQARYGS